jgi:hypothetical protein
MPEKQQWSALLQILRLLKIVCRAYPFGQSDRSARCENNHNALHRRFAKDIAGFIIVHRRHVTAFSKLPLWVVSINFDHQCRPTSVDEVSGRPEIT